MPVKVRKKYKNEKGKPWKIVEVANPRKVVAQSKTKKNATISANIRNAYLKKKGRI